MVVEILIILLLQLLFYFSPVIVFEKHFFLWLVPPVIAGVVTSSAKRGLAASLIATICYILITGSIEGLKRLNSIIGGLVFGFIFGFPILLVMNIVPLLIAYGLKKIFIKIFSK
ncbi:MAG: hypothetical protein DRJ52_09155 [Thermoprotei archaeon]|nr:MAG: hypothetical protein DRJ52_09155 [Thermoprotei archaeon]RLE98944.1 MAG: hypothetical protein DRJ63_06735 [Thermoprotei archaeon]